MDRAALFSLDTHSAICLRTGGTGGARGSLNFPGILEVKSLLPYMTHLFKKWAQKYLDLPTALCFS